MDKHQLTHVIISPTFYYTQEPHAAVAKPIESFTNVLQAVSPGKDSNDEDSYDMDSYDEDSYDMDSYDGDSDDEELEAVDVDRRRRRWGRRKLLLVLCSTQ